MSSCNVQNKTNRYGGCNAKRVNVDRETLVSLFGLVTLMIINRIPRLDNYCNNNFDICGSSP